VPTAAPQPFWLTVFLDFPAPAFDAGTGFWRGYTGWQLSAVRGGAGEFATLLPGAGDAWVRVQRLGGGASRVHLDLHVADPWEAAAAAEGAGAEIVDDSPHSHVVLASPGGFPFCFVRGPGSVPPPAGRWPHESQLAQVSLDVPRERLADELAFWQTTLQGEWDEAGGRQHRAPGEFPVGLLVQPVELAREASAHLHLLADDVEAEAGRLTGLGARIRATRPQKVVLETPGGLVCCLGEEGFDLGLE
jgi:hypothetical protein